MALLLRPKYLLVYKNRRGRAQKWMGEGEKKEEGRGVQERFKGMDSSKI